MGNFQTRQYLVTWYWLGALVVLSVSAAYLLPKRQAIASIFIVAVVKAGLVARNYMHLKHETAIIYAIAIVPIVFIVIFLIGLFPDFVYHVTKP